MAKKVTVSGDRGLYTIDKSNRTWVFDKDCHIVSDHNGINVTPGVTKTTILIQGRIEAGTTDNYTAVYGEGDGCSITIAKGAKALGPFGAVAHGEESHIDNFGTSGAIRLYGADSVATNSGLIRSDITGLSIWEVDGCKIINEKSGRIDVSFDYGPYAAAMRFNTLDGQSGTAINKGTILSGNISGGLGNDTFINTGKVNFDVLLDAGRDTVKNVGGTIKGVIATGAGDDTLITDKKTDLLIEYAGQGRDTVKSSVSYQLSDYVERLILTGSKDINGKGSDGTGTNYLKGNSGDNDLFGLGGVDGLSGGKGKDHLTGGAGQDFFELAKGSGKDTVMDYVNGEDHIVVNGFAGIDNAGEMTSHMHQKTGFVEIDMGKGDILIVKGAVIADLSFYFNMPEGALFSLFP